jgi:hypothetical protein
VKTVSSGAIALMDEDRQVTILCGEKSSVYFNLILHAIEKEFLPTTSLFD